MKKIQDLTAKHSIKWILALVATILFFLVFSKVSSHGLPPGIILLGAIDGTLYALVAMGLVLLYRSHRIINFAQAQIGAMCVALAVTLVSGYHYNYFVAFFFGIIAAALTGAIAHIVIEWRFSNSPRMILTVATLGMAQLLGALQIAIPYLVNSNILIEQFTTPFSFHFQIDNIRFGGDAIFAIVLALICLALLWFFLERTTTGTAIRGAADSRERARLLGIPVKRLSLYTWMIAAVLSGIGAMASAPTDMGNQPTLSAIAGPVVLLPPLAAAVIGQMESLPITFYASVVIGIFQQGVFWSNPRSTSVDVALFIAILIALLLLPPKAQRSDILGIGSFVNVRNSRPIPKALANLGEVKLITRFFPALLAIIIILLPSLAGQQVALPFAYAAIYGLIIVSLVVLSGWGGQISLGQSGFAGVGAATVGLLIVHLHADLFVSLILAGLIGALFAVAIGIPALRIPGLFLSVATLAFAVPVDTYLLNATVFPSLNPSFIPTPLIFGRFNTASIVVTYIVAAILLALLILGVKNLRNSRIGRALIAVRDNQATSQSQGISPTKIKLSAFALSGALAGIAGGLLLLLQQGSSFSGFDPELSFSIFIAAVIGGLGSLTGAILGALYLGLVDYYVSGTIGIVLQGILILVVLMFLPEGLGGIAASIKTFLLTKIAKRHGIDLTKITAQDTAQLVSYSPQPQSIDYETIMSAQNIDVYYGQVQILYNLTLGVKPGEVLALLGTNGAGKSTLLRAFVGLLEPKSGYIKIGGIDSKHLSVENRVREGLVLMPGGKGVFPSLTVKENLELATWCHKGEKEYIEHSKKVIFELFPILQQRLNTEARMLSGGEQQMLAISMAILSRPRLLMIDELSLGLAPVVVAQLLKVVDMMKKQGLTLVIVEQSLNVASAIADRAVFLERGEIKFDGSIGELTTRSDLVRSVFLRGFDPSSLNIKTKKTTTNSHSSSKEIFSALSVSKRYGGVVAINEVSLSIKEGGIYGIIGSNGAGKTTFLDLCSGFIKPDSGHIYFNGKEITNLSPHKRSYLGIARIFQHAGLFPSLTVFETIATAYEKFAFPKEPIANMFKFPEARKSEKLIAAKANELIKLLNLKTWQDMFISELSTGTRRVVELACVLAQEPKLILMDEPSSGLAQKECESLGSLLCEIRDLSGASLLIIEHDVPLIASIADELTCLHLGENIASGPPGEVINNPLVISSFLGVDQQAISRSSGVIKTSLTLQN